MSSRAELVHDDAQQPSSSSSADVAGSVVEDEAHQPAASEVPLNLDDEAQQPAASEVPLNLDDEAQQPVVLCRLAEGVFRVVHVHRLCRGDNAEAFHAP